MAREARASYVCNVHFLALDGRVVRRFGLLGGVLLALGGCSVLVDTSGLTGSSSGKVATAEDASSGGPSGDDTGGGFDAAPPTPIDSGAVEEGYDASLAAPDAPTSVPVDAGEDSALPDTGAQADSGEDSGLVCGPVDTVTNCGACGASCDTTTGTPACNGASCSYTCNTGLSDCSNQSPDLDGCECATPACCGSSCQTVHSDGVGQSFYDCNGANTVSSASAMEACTAYAGDSRKCSTGWDCSGNPAKFVCFSTDNGADCSDYCWGYSGSSAGQVLDCTCPGNKVGSWN
jgi:hypothetical protein